MDNKISKHHDDSLYYEYLAKIVLESKYKDWKLELLDKPDLQDVNNKIGVEVTQILPEGCNQALSLMKAEKGINGELKNKGYNLAMPGLLFHPTKSYEKGKPFPTYNYLLNGIQKKIEKVKTYRKDFKELDLYVFTDNLDMDNETLRELLLRINEANSYAFDNIFIDASYSILHLKDGYAGKYNIDRKDYTNYQYRAMDLEEDMKNE